MTLVSVSGTSLFRCVPERMMKRKTSFYCTVDGTQVLRAVESGIGLGYTFIGKYSNKLLTAQESFFHAAVFDGHAAEVIKTVRDYSQYYDQIRGAQIAEHTLLGREVRKTVFDNGFAVYVNYSNEDAVVENGTVPAQGYLLVKGGVNT